MIREIKKDLIILNNRGPFKPEVKAYLQEFETKEWVYMNLRLAGSKLSREDIDTISDGGYVLDARVEDHLMIDRLHQLRGYIYRLSDMEAELSVNMCGDMHRIITGGRGANTWRKTAPELPEYGDWSPIPPDEIGKAMGDLIRFVRRNEELQDNFLKATRIHNRIIEIFPYNDGNEYLARCAMYYFLVTRGYPIADIDMTEQEYNESIISYLQKSETEALYQALIKGMHSRLEMMMQLTDY